ncbi:hypothetical protein CONLIGDRAFT_675680 [Coniochaeta ligniaria NRRL 30616]|uniref:RBR-type E3 ubiquitin transferase n=1 Tax=Coniochaeta ligniaria NRRL 30616 TaxID=1408157 RepID=A0A1J7J4N2_9PEZI|nr:hypothetical protein CONLIGDRAFT_675680 [Coniochaeta ligniaria NRRL 30616]
MNNKDYGCPHPTPSQGQFLPPHPRRRRRRTVTRDDRESLEFARQVKIRRRQIMEQRSSMMSGDFDEEVDWTKYDPPEALKKLPDITSETIIAVVQSSLENIKNQIQAERLRAEEQRTAILEEADAEAAAVAAEAEEGKGKGKAPVDSGLSVRQPNGQPAALPTPRSSYDLVRPPLKPQKRSRFGISRILRHVRGNSESKSESSSSNPSVIPLHTRVNNEMAPTPFTQFIYKHLKPSLESVGEQVECVSCLDDIPKKEAIKTVCHHYCKDCFSRLIQTAVDNEAQWPPKCCLNAIPFRTITKHTSADLLASYRLKDEEFRIPIESRLYCSQPDCGAWIRKEAHDLASRTATCPAGHTVCTMCRGPAHPPGDGEACPQDRDTQLADRLAEEEGWRRCARCSVLVEHKEACQHMTCRCGAEFCYVCGARWRTCACTMEQLAEIKQRAAKRREERTVEEEIEAREMAEALRLVEEFEREEGRKEELRREEARRKREERRRREAEERARREEARRVELDGKYRELGATLVKLEGLQRMVMDYSHDREMEESIARASEARAKLDSQQELEREELRAAAAAKAADREMQLDREYAGRVAWERKLEEDYEAVMGLFWSDKIGGLPRVREAARAYMRKNDERMEAWRKWRDQEMEKTRYLLDDEVAVREELMDAGKRRLEDRLEGEQAEVGRKQRAEGRWFGLVVEERRRLLAEVEMVERENGGEDGEGSGSNMSFGSEGAWESEDEFDDFKSKPRATSTSKHRNHSAGKMLFFGGLIYISCLLVNAIAILSEDRFLARIGLSPSSYDPAFGQSGDTSIRAKVVQLIASVRTLMRSMCTPAPTLSML